MPCVNLRGDLQAAEPLRLDPDRTIKVLADQVGNRWSRWMAPSGIATLRYSTNPDLQRQPGSGAALGAPLPDSGPAHRHLPVPQPKPLLRHRRVDGAGLGHLWAAGPGLATGDNAEWATNLSTRIKLEPANGEGFRRPAWVWRCP